MLSQGDVKGSGAAGMERAAPGEVRVRRALLSVSDKRGIVDFARGLQELGVELVSTGGTARELSAAGLAVRPIEQFTGFPEVMEGRVKTLHPRLYAGLLARRDEDSHLQTAAEQDVEQVDLVCVNLYPFEQTVARGDASEQEIVENIDIGGPTMIRAAAKNSAFAAVVVDPADYEEVLAALRDAGGLLSLEMRTGLAAKAFAATARYEAAIAAWFATRVHGEGFDQPACAIVKHNSPCGCAVAAGGREAYERAFACDPQSAYGGVIAINRRADAATGAELSKQFIEVLLAPGFDAEALAALQQKKNVRLLELAQWPPPSREVECKPVIGGQLAQTHDVVSETREQMRVLTAAAPSEEQWAELLFAWEVCRHVRSNAIVLAAGGATIGIGAGQMSRVDAVRIAIEKARANRPELLEGAVLASDAFFPFADGPELALAAGVRAIIQPGGSVRDEEVVAGVDAAGAAMVATGVRHFRH